MGPKGLVRGAMGNFLGKHQKKKKQVSLVKNNSTNHLEAAFGHGKKSGTGETGKVTIRTQRKKLLWQNGKRGEKTSGTSNQR